MSNFDPNDTDHITIKKDMLSKHHKEMIKSATWHRLKIILDALEEEPKKGKSDE